MQVAVFGEWGDPVCPDCDALAKEEAARQRSIAVGERQRELQELRTRNKLEAAFNRTCIPPRFADRKLDNFIAKNDAQTKALAVCSEYARAFSERLKSGTSIIFCGNTGTGKTHLACGIAHEVMGLGKNPLYCTVGRALRQVKSTYNRDSEQSEQAALESFCSPDLLILDEVGVQYGSDAERNILFEIINERYERMKPTILISNLALSELTEFVGARVIDRMRENGGKLLVFDWKSHRGATA